MSLTKEDAIRLVREHAWRPQVSTCGHRGCEDHLGSGPAMIHTRRGGFGIDSGLGEIEREIETAASVEWVDSLLDHNLAIVQPDGKYCCVDVPRPKEAS